MDIALRETGNGGDAILHNNDIVVNDTIYNQPYLAHFGANPDPAKEGENTDWWGNYMFDDNAKMNGKFELEATKTALNSNGRVLLERTAKSDMEYLQDVCEVVSSVQIIGVNKISLSDTMKFKNNKYKYIWDAIKDVIIEEKAI